MVIYSFMSISPQIKFFIRFLGSIKTNKCWICFPFPNFPSAMQVLMSSKKTPQKSNNSGFFTLIAYHSQALFCMLHM